VSAQGATGSDLVADGLRLAFDNGALSWRGGFQGLQAGVGATGASMLRHLHAAGEDVEALRRAAWVAARRPVASFSAEDIDFAAFADVSFDALVAARAVPLRREDGAVVLAVASPPRIEVIDRLRFTSAGAAVRLELAEDPLVVDAALRRWERVLRREADASAVADATKEEVIELEAGEEALSGFVNQLLVRTFEEAIGAGASDVHFEPSASLFEVRLRVDGVLRTLRSYPLRIAPAVLSRLKALSGMNIADHLRAADGRTTMALQGRTYDLRVVTMPTTWGLESAVVRILDPASEVLRLDALGLSGHAREVYARLWGSAWGMVVVSGPTGAGKTSTLYATIAELAGGEERWRKLVSVEDPVEYRIPSVTQVPVNPLVGLDFAEALRHVLRADADVILVGEIRDPETTKVAVDASLTGHLVLATVHAYSATSVIGRLVEMGAMPGSLSGCLRGVLNQRLVRRLCPSCRVPVAPFDLERSEEAALLAYGGISLHQAFSPGARSCARCGGVGYAGRLAVGEVFEVAGPIGDAIAARVSEGELRRLTVGAGMRTLWQSAADLVEEGATSIQEAIRVLGRPEPPVERAAA
jgi:type II secretory ATPase GspE/PulE/Tfp pilus assembly ATPase PilB-like protein